MKLTKHVEQLLNNNNVQSPNNGGWFRALSSFPFAAAAKSTWFAMQLGFNLLHWHVHWCVLVYFCGHDTEQLRSCTCFAFVRSAAKSNKLFIKLFQSLIASPSWQSAHTESAATTPPVPHNPPTFAMLRWMPWLQELQHTITDFSDRVPFCASDIDPDVVHALRTRFPALHCPLPGDNGGDCHGMVLNSGMISIVSQGTMDGRKVVIKWLRRGIRDELTSAIEVWRNLLTCLRWWGVDRHLLGSVESVLHTIPAQTDFKQEVRNLQQFAQRCAHLSFVRIPHVYATVTDVVPSVIVMEKLEGRTLQDVRDETERLAYGELVVTFGLISSMVYGISHGDLHPGNILFCTHPDRPHEKVVGIIDFGIVQYLSQRALADCFNILTDLCVKPPPPEEMAENILRSQLVVRTRTLTSAECLRAKTMLVDTCRELQRTSTFSPALWIHTLHRLLLSEDLGIQPSKTVVHLNTILLMAHGTTLTLCGPNFKSVLTKVMRDLFAPVIDLFADESDSNTSPDTNPDTNLHT